VDFNPVPDKNLAIDYLVALRIYKAVCPQNNDLLAGFEDKLLPCFRLIAEEINNRL